LDVIFHVNPELVETKTPPGHCAAIILVPFGVQAIHGHQLSGEREALHVCASTSAAASSRANPNHNRIFIINSS
jgi:hypothetical protein